MGDSRVSGVYLKVVVGFLVGYAITAAIVDRAFATSKTEFSHHHLQEVTGGKDGASSGKTKPSSSSKATSSAAIAVRDVGLLFPTNVPGSNLIDGSAVAIMSLQQQLPACPSAPNALVVKHSSSGSKGPAEAPREIPARLQARFTLDGRIDIKHEYYNDVSWGTGGDEARHYSAVDIGNMVTQVKAKGTGDYEPTDRALYALLDRYPDLLKGKRVIVMGSVRPWYEALAFAYGASEVLTVEYGLRKTDYPNFSFATPMGVANCSLSFDVGLSISSFEHDGLGRYGDPLNPEGDLVAMAAMKRLVKPGGMLLFAVPMGSDTIVYNAHRLYGKYRWPLMTAGWEVVDYAGVPQELWVSPWSNHLQPAWLLRNTPHRT